MKKFFALLLCLALALPLTAAPAVAETQMEEERLDIGDSILLKSCRLTLEGCGQAEMLNPFRGEAPGGPYWYYSNDDGSPFFYVTGRFTNLSAQPVDIRCLYAAFEYDGQYSYAASAAAFAPNGTDFFTEVSPLQTVEYYIYATLPSALTGEGRNRFVLRLGFADDFSAPAIINANGLPQFEHCDNVYTISLTTKTAAAITARYGAKPAQQYYRYLISPYQTLSACKALGAVQTSQQMVNAIEENWGGLIHVTDTPGDGRDPDVDYAKLKNTSIKAGTLAGIHEQVLKEAQAVLLSLGVKMEIQRYPNLNALYAAATTRSICAGFLIAPQDLDLDEALSQGDQYFAAIEAAFAPDEEAAPGDETAAAHWPEYESILQNVCDAYGLDKDVLLEMAREDGGEGIEAMANRAQSKAEFLQIFQRSINERFGAGLEISIVDPPQVSWAYVDFYSLTQLTPQERQIFVSRFMEDAGWWTDTISALEKEAAQIPIENLQNALKQLSQPEADGNWRHWLEDLL